MKDTVELSKTALSLKSSSPGVTRLCSLMEEAPLGQGQESCHGTWAPLGAAPSFVCLLWQHHPDFKGLLS